MEEEEQRITDIRTTAFLIACQIIVETSDDALSNPRMFPISRQKAGKKDTSDKALMIKRLKDNRKQVEEVTKKAEVITKRLYQMLDRTGDADRYNAVTFEAYAKFLDLVLDKHPAEIQATTEIVKRIQKEKNKD